MAKVRQFIFLTVIFCLAISCKGKSVTSTQSPPHDTLPIVTGAERDSIYMPSLAGRKIGIVANQTSIVNNIHLVDHLLKQKVNIVKVFAPEHGFRGEAGPGDKVHAGTDPKTGLRIVSLYGSHRKPTPDDMSGIDLMIFDIQDVGARFYTYISTLQYVMEACAEHQVKLLVFDRPNPHGTYIDGPVLDTSYRSFVGMDPIPIVHGLTVGEYAKMVNGEGWLKGKIKCDVEVIKMENYNHSKLYQLPVAPSPNLPGMNAIYLYPSLCLFEGTKISVGRGTPTPFEIIGFPGYSKGNISFTPLEIPGVIKDPPYEGELCKGINLSAESQHIINAGKLNLAWLLSMYAAYPDKEKFFTGFFDTLAGTDQLRLDIVAGKTEEEIRESWKPGLEEYRSMRKNYLLYSDK